METVRIDIRIPVMLLQSIEKYQLANGITTRTGALMELVRKGLENSEVEKAIFPPHPL